MIIYVIAALKPSSSNFNLFVILRSIYINFFYFWLWATFFLPLCVSRILISMPDYYGWYIVGNIEYMVFLWRVLFWQVVKLLVVSLDLVTIDFVLYFNIVLSLCHGFYCRAWSLLLGMIFLASHFNVQVAQQGCSTLDGLGFGHVWALVNVSLPPCRWTQDLALQQLLYEGFRESLPVYE